jgi:hypothetical protein
VSDIYLTLEDIKELPDSAFPIMCLANGYTSLFGYLISVVKKGQFYTHFQWLISRDDFASQWWYFRTFPVENYFGKYSMKFWHNPDWTPQDKQRMQEEIKKELVKPKWDTRYDVIGIVGEALNLSWLNSKRQSFCSEKITFLAKVDEGCREWMLLNPHPTPEEINIWLKTQDRFKVVGRVMPS